MRLKLVVAVCFMLLLPLLDSPLKVSDSISAVPYSSIAFAGHTQAGDRWCECNCPECIHAQFATSDNGSGGFSKDVPQSDAAENEIPSDSDFESGVLLTALLVFLWIRFRA